MPRGRRTFAKWREKRPRVSPSRAKSTSVKAAAKSLERKCAHYRCNSPHDDAALAGLQHGRKNMRTWPSSGSGTMCGGPHESRASIWISRIAATWRIMPAELRPQKHRIPTTIPTLESSTRRARKRIGSRPKLSAPGEYRPSLPCGGLPQLSVGTFLRCLV